MSNRRAKATATATVLGLGALGGVAMATNQGLSHPAGGATTASVTTSASGATAAQPAALSEGTSTRAPIVTRASGGAGNLAPIDD
ncbi:MAG TPA: hypothetical protein VFG58_05670 [Solirubrobacterales bacterium]|nr:hypothetical protein [Solirubrobacterales bacterium]